MAQIGAAVRDTANLTAEERAMLHRELVGLRGGPVQDLIRQHAEANVTMYRTDDLYPGTIVELAPDGRRFIVRYDSATPVRLREVI